LIKYLRYVDQPSKLTSKLNYSNTMYAVAGEAGATVAGVSYEELVKTRVFDPLGLANTGFSQSALKSFSNYALPYDAASFEDAKEGNFIRGELDEDYLSDAPAGDIYSNVLDLARWGRAVLKGGEVDGKQVLNKNSIAETWTGRTFALGTRRSADFAPVVAYGMGWAIDAYKGHAQYSHSKYTCIRLP
jgi:CubicO group peptidase (beta-lactamase class C family)